MVGCCAGRKSDCKVSGISLEKLSLKAKNLLHSRIEKDQNYMLENFTICIDLLSNLGRELFSFYSHVVIYPDTYSLAT